jgi:molecular chaperone GrpE (heat shock protein)
MQSLSLHETAAQNASPDLELQISELESRLAERRAELVALQQELRAFKERYAKSSVLSKRPKRVSSILK